MGTCRWMGSHFRGWIDYNRVAFSLESLEWDRPFSGLPWVPETFLARFPVSDSRYGSCLAARGFGLCQHRKFPPHARNTSGTQGISGFGGSESSGTYGFKNTKIFTSSSLTNVSIDFRMTQLKGVKTRCINRKLQPLPQ